MQTAGNIRQLHLQCEGTHIIHKDTNDRTFKWKDWFHIHFIKSISSSIAAIFWLIVGMVQSPTGEVSHTLIKVVTSLPTVMTHAHKLLQKITCWIWFQVQAAKLSYYWVYLVLLCLHRNKNWENLTVVNKVALNKVNVKLSKKDVLLIPDILKCVNRKEGMACFKAALKSGTCPILWKRINILVLFLSFKTVSLTNEITAGKQCDLKQVEKCMLYFAVC